MGYLKVNTTGTGEVIIHTDNILYVKKTGQAIDFVMDIGPSQDRAEIRLNGSGITEDTKNKFNEAVIQAQSQAVVTVAASIDEVFETISLDPA